MGVSSGGTMSDLYLTSDELQDHTGLIQAAAQRRMLEKDGLRKGVHFFVRADGKLRLLRAALVERSKPVQKVQPGPAQPNFEALHASR